MGRPEEELRPAPEYEYGIPIPLWTEAELEKVLTNLLPVYEVDPDDDYNETLVEKRISIAGKEFRVALVARNPVYLLSRHVFSPIPDTKIAMTLRSGLPPKMETPPPIEFLVDIEDGHPNVEQYSTITLKDIQKDPPEEIHPKKNLHPCGFVN